MPLSKAEIAQLRVAALQQQRKKAAKGPDPNNRTHQTWFKLPTKLSNLETGELCECSNPNCQDYRRTLKKAIAVVEIKGQDICRICFMEGYLLDDPDQLTLT